MLRKILFILFIICLPYALAAVSFEEKGWAISEKSDMERFINADITKTTGDNFRFSLSLDNTFKSDISKGELQKYTDCAVSKTSDCITFSNLQKIDTMPVQVFKTECFAPDDCIVKDVTKEKLSKTELNAFSGDNFDITHEEGLSVKIGYNSVTYNATGQTYTWYGDSTCGNGTNRCCTFDDFYNDIVALGDTHFQKQGGSQYYANITFWYWGNTTHTIQVCGEKQQLIFDGKILQSNNRNNTAVLTNMSLFGRETLTSDFWVFQTGSLATINITNSHLMCPTANYFPYNYDKMVNTVNVNAVPATPGSTAIMNRVTSIIQPNNNCFDGIDGEIDDIYGTGCNILVRRAEALTNNIVITNLKGDNYVYTFRTTGTGTGTGITRMINPDVPIWNVTFQSATCRQRLDRVYTFELRTNYINQTPNQGVNVTLTNNISDTLFSALTDSSGYIIKNVTYGFYNSTGQSNIYSNSPFNISLTKDGYAPYYDVLDMDRKEDLRIVMDRLPFDYRGTLLIRPPESILLRGQT